MVFEIFNLLKKACMECAVEMWWDKILLIESKHSNEASIRVSKYYWYQLCKYPCENKLSQQTTIRFQIELIISISVYLRRYLHAVYHKWYIEHDTCFMQIVNEKLMSNWILLREECSSTLRYKNTPTLHSS